jgi:hypothetical protein
MLTNILIGLAIILVVFLIIAALQPGDFRVMRSTLISAPAAVVFAEVNDFHRWPAWSPWEKLDPAMKRTYAGPDAGTGASFSWSGNKKAGQGRATIVESRPGERVLIKLEFLKPFPSTCQSEYSFRPEGAETKVTWSMTGSRHLLIKAVNLVVSMDKLMGGDFEKGLTELKIVAEKAASRGR